MFNPQSVKNNIIEWIREYFKENGNESKAVLGISGGKDSSVAAALCVEAIGRDRVYGVLLPEGVQHDIDVAKELVNFLGIEYSIINIAEATGAINNCIVSSNLTINKQAAINTPSRVRMTILYAVSAIMNGRVVNTCNLSEDWVGYSTKFGDSAGDFSPLSDLTVTEIKAVGSALGLPSKFIDKLPEDGLTGLSDEENLGFSYDVLDQYIRSGVCEDLSIKEKIDKLHKNNLHKIQPMPFFKLL